MKLALQDRREASGWATIFALIAVVCLGQAIQVGFGFFHPVAIVFVGVALAALVLGVLCSRLPDPGPWAIPLIRAMGFGAVAVQLWQLATVQPAQALMGRPVNDFLALLFVFAGFTVPFCLELPSFKRLASLGWFISFCVAAVWILHATYPPPIDVFSYTHAALDALKDGTHPYTILMPNDYGVDMTSGVPLNEYGQPVTPDGKFVKGCYPYPPFSLMLSGLGYLFGDMRWANLAFVVGGVAMLLRYGGPFAAIGAALLLTTPRIFFVLENAWTDAYCFGLLAITAGLATRSSRLTPWVFGLALVTKQYMVLLAPLALLLLPKPWTFRQAAIFVGQTILAGCIVTLPWVLWDPQVLMGSTQVSGIKPRLDSLTFLFLIYEGGEGKYVGSLAFLLLIPTYALILLFSARGTASFALSAALILGVFFSFAKHSLCNHHFLVLGCAAIAFATVRFGEEAPSATTRDGTITPTL